MIIGSVVGCTFGPGQLLPTAKMHYRFDSGDETSGSLKNYATGTNDAVVNGLVADTSVKKVGTASYRNPTALTHTLVLPSVVLPAPAAGFSVSFWMYNTTLNPTGGWWGISTSNQLSEICMYTPQSSSRIGVRVLNNGADNYFETTGTISLNTWYHIAVNFSSASPKLFVNSVSTALGNSGVNPGYVSGTSNPYGTNYVFRTPLLKNGGGFSANVCNIDDFRLFGSQLTAQQVGILNTVV